MPTTLEESRALANTINQDLNRTKGSPQRLGIILGMKTKGAQYKAKEDIPEKDRSAFSMEKYAFLLDSPFKISDKCCNVMKKTPAHEYYRKNKRAPIMATMAQESRLRKQKWIQNGCNGFEMQIPTSTPMSFWTEQDVLQYIKRFKLPIASVYGEIVPDEKNELEGQMNISQFIEAPEPKLKTTGCKRTGCMFCGYGCHIRGDERFVRMKETHPKQYEYIMRPEEEGGLGYKEKIDWLNDNGNLNIRY